MPQSPSIFSEAASAARGVAALIVGDRAAPKYFDLTTHGLVGSFIALLVVTGVNAAMPMFLGRPGLVLTAFAAYAILLVVQVVCSAIVLKQLNRFDGFVPYLVADNWSSVIVSIVTMVLGVGLSSQFLAIPLAVLVIVIAVNIGRLILRLEPLQVAVLVIAQLVGALIGSFAISSIVPIPAAVLAGQ